MIEMILTITLAVVLVELIRTKRTAQRYKADRTYYKKEYVVLRCRNIEAAALENMRMTSNTGCIPSAIPDDSLDASVYRCNICGNDMWRSRDCHHWPGVTYVIEEDGDKRREIKCAPIIENAEETQEEKKAHV